MVKLSPRKREIRGDGRNHCEKLRRKRIPCGSQFTIPDMARNTLNLAGNNTDTGSSQPNQITYTPDFTGQLASSISLSSSSPSLSLSSTTLPSLQEHKVKSSLSISPCHHHEVSPSGAYSEGGIRRVQHTPIIVIRPCILAISS